MVMKRLMIAALVAAAGVVGAVQTASAGQYVNPIIPMVCETPIGDSPVVYFRASMLGRPCHIGVVGGYFVGI
jgi:hypothetical protein